jgi:hypothetical protein
LVQETVPAGTTVNPAQAFTKSWTIRNNGTCNWVGYYFDLVGGARLGGTRVSLPTVATNTDIPVTLNLVSPAEGGTHRGEWRVYNSQGQAFPQTFVVEINVPGSCANPVIDRFDATSLVIGPDQNTTLSWAVSGATTVTLEPGPQLPGTTGSITVSPDQTTTYTLRAVNGACSSTRQLTINVSNSPGAPAAPTTLDEDETRRTQTSVTLTWNDNSTNETQFRLYLVDTNALVATFPANATEGTLFNRTCNTAYDLVLRSANVQGESANSNVIMARTTPCP